MSKEKFEQFEPLSNLIYQVEVICKVILCYPQHKNDSQPVGPLQVISNS